MSSRSTPLGALRRDEDLDQSTRDMVNGIVNELEDPMGLPGGAEGYQEGFHDQMGPPMMDYGAPPDERMYMEQYPDGGMSDNMMQHGGMQGQQMLPPGDPRMSMGGPPQNAMDPYNGMHSGMLNGNGNGNVYTQQKGMVGQLMDMVTKNSKEPMLAAALFLIMSNDMVSTMLSRYIPYAASPMLGLGLRALLVAVLFFVVKNFILKR